MIGNEKTLQDDLLAWAGSDDGYSYLRKIAVGLLSEVNRNGALAAVWPYRLSTGGEDKNDVIDEVAHDFYLFMTASFVPELPNHPDHIHLAEIGNFSKLFGYARNKFLWQWQDKARSKELNPGGYLYRRLRETLSRDQQFQTRRMGNGAFLYRLRIGGQPEKFRQTIFDGEDFSSWPSFHERRADISEKELFKADYQKKVALFFWHEAVRRITVEALAVRDLNRFIVFQHPWLLNPVMISEPADIGFKEDVESQLDIMVNVRGMAILAEQLVSTWSLQQCKVFLLRLEEPPVKLKVIADSLNLHDSNRVHRLFVSCKESLISFSSSWPGPPLSELPEICGEIFLKQVKKSAKNRIAARNEK